MDKRGGSASSRRNISNAEMETMSKQIYDEIIDELVLGVAFDVHRSVKTGMFAILETDASKSKNMDQDFNQSTNLGIDVFGQVIQTMVGVPALKKQPECICPNCQRNLAASRFAPHLEKCMGMGRNSSRIASRRLAKGGQEVTSYRESGRYSHCVFYWIGFWRSFFFRNVQVWMRTKTMMNGLNLPKHLRIVAANIGTKTLQDDKRDLQVIHDMVIRSESCKTNFWCFWCNSQRNWNCFTWNSLKICESKILVFQITQKEVWKLWNITTKIPWNHPILI